MQLAQKRQPRRGLALEHHDNERKSPLRLHPLIERLVVFGHLPFADAGFADEQDESGRVGDFLRQLRRPGAAGAQVRGSKKDP